MPLQIPLVPSVPEGLRLAGADGRLVPFVGAGLSRLAGGPSWLGMADQLIGQLVRECALTHAEAHLLKDKQAKLRIGIAEVVAQEKGIALEYERIFEIDEWESLPNGESAYSALGQLSDRFVTTNYDRWLEKKFSPKEVNLNEDQEISGAAAGELSRRAICQKREFPIGSSFRNGTVVHLHGSVRERDSMVLTPRDYALHYANDRTSEGGDNENLVLTFLEDLFDTKTVLFVGYGLEEMEVLEYILQKTRSTAGEARERNHFMFHGFFSHEASLANHMSVYYREQFGVKLLPYCLDNKGYIQLIDVLEKFAAVIPIRDASINQKKFEMETLLK